MMPIRILIVILTFAPSTFSIIFAIPHKLGKEKIIFFIKWILSVAVFFLYEEQLLWLLQAFSDECKSNEIKKYFMYTSPRVKELPLLPISDQKDINVSVTRINLMKKYERSLIKQLEHNKNIFFWYRKSTSTWTKLWPPWCPIPFMCTVSSTEL